MIGRGEVRRIISLTEYETRSFGREAIGTEAAEMLWRDYDRQVHVEPPSFKTGDRWQLTAQGWAGFIPVTADLSLALQPKAPLDNLFRMMEVAYGLQSVHFEDRLYEAASLLAFYESLAQILAQRVLARCRRGLYCAYVDRTQRLSTVRGRIQVPQMVRTPWHATLPCRYEEHTADVEDNQILAWALHCILRSGLCTERTLPTVRRAYRTLLQQVTLHPFSADACRNRTYQRLNGDYRPLHALSYFFLDQSGPAHLSGEHAMRAFTIDMARLYERFVAAWLQQHAPTTWRVEVQERCAVGPGADLHFQIDLALYHTRSNRVCTVLDTKYKTPVRTPETADVQQVLAYAHATGATQALLVYPSVPPPPLDEWINGIRVRSVAFALEGDMDERGNEFLRGLALQPHAVT